MTWREQARLAGPWWSIAAGGLVAVLVLLVGAVLLSGRSPTWSADASVVVMPSRQLDPGIAAGYYETLSRGQMVSTVAEIIRLPVFTRAAEDQLHLRGAQRSKVKIEVGVVPNTAMITVTATAATRGQSEALANTILARSGDYLTSLNSPYAVDGVSVATGTAQRGGLTTGSLVAALLIGALALGLATQQLVHQVLVAGPRRREGAGWTDANTDTNTNGDAVTAPNPVSAVTGGTIASPAAGSPADSPNGNHGLQPAGPRGEG